MEDKIITKVTRELIDLVKEKNLDLTEVLETNALAMKKIYHRATKNNSYETLIYDKDILESACAITKRYYQRFSPKRGEAE